MIRTTTRPQTIFTSERKFALSPLSVVRLLALRGQWEVDIDFGYRDFITAVSESRMSCDCQKLEWKIHICIV